MVVLSNCVRYLFSKELPKKKGNKKPVCAMKDCYKSVKGVYVNNPFGGIHGGTHFVRIGWYCGFCKVCFMYDGNMLFKIKLKSGKNGKEIKN